MTLADLGDQWRPAYAAPLVAMDKVVDLTADGIRTVKAVSGNEAFFAGHFPDFPIFPGVFVLEAVHQATRTYVARRWPADAEARLAEVSSVRFQAAVRPGDVLEIDCRCRVRPDDGALLVNARCSSLERPVALASLRYEVRPVA
jgi:3-hydroxyacyl-[acyl-carrier-protein] dehydratase